MNYSSRNIAVGLVALLMVIALSGKAQNNSVLSSGEWYKFAVTADGVYKIDYSLLKQAGLNPDQVNPKKLKIYTGYHAMLPQANNSALAGELKEIAIKVEGEADEKFNNNDYILFYGQGPDMVEFVTDKGMHIYENNLYADKNHYFLTFGDADGKRISSIESSSGTYPVVNSFDDYAFYETEKYNLLKSGRHWFGEQFDANLEATIRFEIAGIIENSTIKFISHVMAQSTNNSSFQVSFNNSPILTQPIAAIPNTTYGIKGIVKADTLQLNSNSVGAASRSNQDIKYQFTKGSSGLSVGYLDYFMFSFKRRLALYNEQTIFLSSESLKNATSKFEISGTSAASKVWNISLADDVKEQKVELSSTSVSFSVPSVALQKYVVFNVDKLKGPTFESKIANQNLRNITVPELLIITPPSLQTEAIRLAQHREKQYNITSRVVTTQQIYNEFSSGKQDITGIRNFIRSLYSRSSTLKNVLLFGRGSYDYKSRVLNNTNLVPIYESRNSLSPLETFSSDDYYGFLEINEGDWFEAPAQDHTLDVGIGRLPVKNLAEAKVVVDKLIEYDTNTNSTLGWQHDFLFVADDGDFNIHQQQADQLANSIESYDPSINVRKFFLDRFQQLERASGQYSPEAQNALNQEINRGAAIVNFTGHGSEQLWMDERILDENLIAAWKQAPKYPLFLTATCEFGRNDDPMQISSGEKTFLQPKGGSIGLVTTSRPVSSSTNFTLNKAFYESLFTKSNGTFRDLGSIFRDTKNKSISGVGNRNFSLLADPSMKLVLASAKVEIDDVHTESGSTDLKALSKLKVKGHIEKNGQPANYEGELLLSLYDGIKTLVTKGDENPPFYFDERTNVLFKGKTDVKQGEFETEFVLTKNISPEKVQSKLAAVATSKNAGTASGAKYLSIIPEIEITAPSDSEPPRIRLFMGDTTFINGGTVGPNTKIVALLSDLSGINSSANNPDNQVLATLDNAISYSLGSYYYADLNTFKKGKIDFPLFGLEKGRHTLKLAASDTYNNRATAEVEFVVTSGEQILIESFTNYPNPFYESTTLEFTHTRPGEDLEITMTIYDYAGRDILSKQFEVPASQYRVSIAQWDGTASNGTKLSRGIYLARLAVRSLLDGSKNEEYTKLIITN